MYNEYKVSCKLSKTHGHDNDGISLARALQGNIMVVYDIYVLLEIERETMNGFDNDINRDLANIMNVGCTLVYAYMFMMHDIVEWYKQAHILMKFCAICWIYNNVHVLVYAFVTSDYHQFIIDFVCQLLCSVV